MAIGFIAKVVMVILNIAFLLIGLALIAGGAILAFIPGPIFQFILDGAKKIAEQTSAYSVPEDISNLPMLHEVGVAIFVLGIFLTILSFLGCCGSCSSCCKCLLIGFAIVMIVLMIAEIIVCSLFFAKDSVLHDNVKTELKNQVKHYNETDKSDAFYGTMTMLHLYLECCGVDSVNDYNYYSSISTPKSCKSYTLGCYTKLTNYIQDNLLYAGLALGGLLLLQLIEVIFAVIIFKTNKIFPV